MINELPLFCSKSPPKLGFQRKVYLWGHDRSVGDVQICEFQSRCCWCSNRALARYVFRLKATMNLLVREHTCIQTCCFEQAYQFQFR